MKTIRFILMATTVLIVASCGSSKQVQQQPQQPVYQQQSPNIDARGRVVLEKSPIQQLAEATGTNEIRAYGAATEPDEQLAYNSARAEANVALQERMQVYVRAGLDRYTQRTGVNKEYRLDQSTRNQVQAAVQAILVGGSKIVDSRTLYDPNTDMITCEVCVAYDRAGILNAMKAQSDRILANEKQFEQDMQHAWDALDAQNNTVSLSEQQAARKNEMEQNNLDREHQRNMQYQNQQNQYNLQSQQMNQQYQQQQYQQQYQQNYQNPQGQQYQQYPQQQYPNQYQQYPQGQQY